MAVLHYQTSYCSPTQKKKSPEQTVEPEPSDDKSKRIIFCSNWREKLFKHHWLTFVNTKPEKKDSHPIYKEQDEWDDYLEDVSMPIVKFVGRSLPICKQFWQLKSDRNQNKWKIR